MTLPKHGKAALLPLARALDRMEPALQMGIMAGMESIGVAAIPHFLPLLQHKRRAVRMQAARSLAALFPRYHGPKAEANALAKALVKSALQLKEANAWRDLQKILCQRTLQPVHHLTTALQQALATKDAAAGTGPRRRSWIRYAAGGLPPPLARIVALLQCHHPLPLTTYRALIPLVPKAPITIQIKLMGLFATPGPATSGIINQAWSAWLKSPDDRMVETTLDRMARLPLALRPTAQLKQRLYLLLARGTPGQRWRAARQLGLWNDASGVHVPALRHALQRGQPRLRHVAAVALARQGLSLAALLQHLKSALDDRSDIAKAGALLALGEATPARPGQGSSAATHPTTAPAARAPATQPTSRPASRPLDPTAAALEQLKKGLHATSPTLREAATAALGRWAQQGHQRAGELLLVALVDNDEDVRSTAVQKLSALKQHTRVGVVGLTQALRDRSPRIRKHAARGLGQQGLQGAPALQALRDASRKETDYLAKHTMIQARRLILRALRKQAPR